MKISKKLLPLFGVAAMATTALPLITMVSCGAKLTGIKLEPELENQYYEVGKN